MSEWRLAWRNVWRSPRRTALTVAATVFAVFLVIVFVAMARGAHEKMIEDSVRLSSGHAMVAAPGYLDDPSLDHAFALDASLARRLDAVAEVVGWAPRVVSFALVSENVTSQGVGLIGVDPLREAQLTTLAEHVSRGRFLAAEPPASTTGSGRANGDAREILLGERLADRIDAELGDEVLVYGVAYSLETAYELFTVVGLLDLPDAGMERTLAVVGLRTLQDFLVLGDRVSEIAVLAASAEHTRPLRDALLRELDGTVPVVAVHAWPEVLPDLEQMLILDDAGLYMMIAILVVVVGFGILNTILMAVLERKRELGVMLALGLQPAAVFRVVFLESLLLASLGLVIGTVLAVPFALWLQANPIPLGGSELAAAYELIGAEPILAFRITASTVWKAALLILGVAFLASLYPAFKASRANPVEALRSV